MKGFLIFLAFAFPVVLVSPFFWSLVRMEWGAERIGYHYKDGVAQWASLGPRSPWPRWALVPEGMKLTIRASYEPAPGAAHWGPVSWRWPHPANRRAPGHPWPHRPGLHGWGWTPTGWMLPALWQTI